MRIFVTLLFLIFSFQSWIKADDITDFQIEGISVGDNLLDHFTVNQINKAYKNTYPKSKKFYGLQFELTDYETYKYIQAHIKSGSNYIVSSIIGGEFFDNINKCYQKQKIIVRDLKKTFSNAEVNEYKTTYPDDPKSSIKIAEFYLSNFDVVVSCTDWSKKAETTGNTDNLRVEISSLEFSKFITTEAY